MTIEPEQVTIVLPVRNETKGIHLVLKELSEAGYRNILVIDGYSTDGTAEVARAMNAKVIQQHWKGKTGGLKAAFEDVSTPYLIVMDGDLTYDPRDIGRFLVHAKNYDHIIGRRTRHDRIPFINRMGNRIINLCFHIFTGVDVSDVGSGMYLLRTSVARTLELHSSGVDSEVEIATQTVANHRVTEVPITYRDRVGESKLSPLRDGGSDILMIISLSRLYNPVAFFSALGSLLIIPGGMMFGWSVYTMFITGVWHLGWVVLGTILLFLGAQAFLVGTMSILLRRMERRLVSRLRELR